VGSGHSMTWSARARIKGGIVKPNIWVVLRLTAGEEPAKRPSALDP